LDQAPLVVVPCGGTRRRDGCIWRDVTSPGRRIEICSLPSWTHRHPQSPHDARGFGPRTTRIRVDSQLGHRDTVSPSCV